MRNTISHIICRTITLLSCLSFLLHGCGEKPESPKPTVITQKIDIAKKAKPSQSQTASPVPIKAEDETKPSAKIAGLGKEAKPEIAPSAPKQPIVVAETASEPTQETGEESAETVAYFYNPKGKIDPFALWAEDSGTRTSASSAQQKEKRTFLTPLEKIDISQLKLVGIILSATGNSAIVEEASGKGYVIDKGTYIGRNSGRVTQILKDRVIIEETVKYGISEASIRKKELKLQKPPGEE